MDSLREPCGTNRSAVFLTLNLSVYLMNQKLFVLPVYPASVLRHADIVQQILPGPQDPVLFG